MTRQEELDQKIEDLWAAFRRCPQDMKGIYRRKLIELEQIRAMEERREIGARP